jgi:hypothetical protein
VLQERYAELMVAVTRRSPRWLALAALMSSGCGLTAEAPPPTPCIESRLRLSSEACEAGWFLVERCTADSWKRTSECRQPDDCSEGAEEETGELCGEFEYNSRLRVCSGGLWQEECTCGTENYLSGYWKDGWEDVRGGLESVGFPYNLALTADGIDPPKNTFVDVKCVYNFGIYRSASEVQFPSLVAVSSLSSKGRAIEEFLGLESLRRMDGLYLEDAMNLTSLQGLRALRDPGPYLVVLRTGLRSFEGLEGLTQLREIHVNENENLSSLEGLQNVVRSGFNVLLWRNASLTSLDGLRSLEVIEGDLTIEGSPLITSLDGLASLRRVTGAIRIELSQVHVCDVKSFFFRPEMVMDAPGAWMENLANLDCE